ncbi:MAG TPA: hypothetical protein PKL03_01840 [Candidatus Omnitrophota bacterium]|nr:hypothetical protein [Candidatus Omnitrophota bacterium]
MIQPTSNGLIKSFISDTQQATRANTYDQALAVKCFLASGDKTSAQTVLDYFKNIRDAYKNTPQGQANPGIVFFKSYNIDSGIGSVSEDIMRTGDTAWLGLASLQYSKNTGSNTYTQLARDIGDYLVSLDAADNGTPGLLQDPRYGSTVKSTEENIDAYMFLKQLGAQTRDKKYTQTANTTLTYIKSMFNTDGNYFNCGSSGSNIDTMFLTDVQAMAIFAFGKDGLESMGIDVKAFVASVETRGQVKDAPYTTLSGEPATVTGFGFTENDNKISAEWTAQMVIAYLVLANDYENDGDLATAQQYYDKAEFYYTELGKMANAQGNLPYSTSKNAVIVASWGFNTSDDSGALSATAYYQLACAGDNPYTPEVENLWK